MLKIFNMLSLKQICSIYATDKNILHSYVDKVYEDIFKDLRFSTHKFLEIGVENGASLFMWRDYFENAHIIGVDNKDCPQARDRDRIKFILGNAYSYEISDGVGQDFDIIIDDGPHTLESMSFVILEYLNKISTNGMLVIEDIQDFHWTNILKRQIPEGFKVDVYDLRKVRDRYDDILMTIRKSRTVL